MVKSSHIRLPGFFFCLQTLNYGLVSYQCLTPRQPVRLSQGKALGESVLQNAQGQRQDDRYTGGEKETRPRCTGQKSLQHFAVQQTQQCRDMALIGRSYLSQKALAVDMERLLAGHLFE